MRRFFASAIFSVPLAAMAADNMTPQEWLDLFVDSCVGSGSSFIVSGSIDAGANLSLRKLRIDGTLAGQVAVKKESYRLLSAGISNAMSDAAAGQADKVRECLLPIRQTLLEAMNRQMGTSGKAGASIYILSRPEEVVIKSLAVTKGEDGETGKKVPREDLLKTTGISDLLLRATMRELESKGLATEARFARQIGTGFGATLSRVDGVSLLNIGEEYVLKMGYAK